MRESEHKAKNPERPAPKAMVGRVGLYLRQLEAFQEQGHEQVSSRQLGLALNLNNAQVRKDLAFFGHFGARGIGYRLDDLICRLQRILGVDRHWELALVGVGNLGKALINYRGFQHQAFRIGALFDNDPALIGRSHGGLVVHGLDELDSILTSRKIVLALNCVPARAAQAVADELARCRILGILNFAPIRLNVPAHVSVVDVDLGIHLENLAYHVLNHAPAMTLPNVNPRNSDAPPHTAPGTTPDDDLPH